MSSETPQENRPDREKLAAYALGKLSDAESERVAEAIENDSVCQAMLGTFDEAEDTLAGNLRRPAADDPSHDGPFDAESQCDAAVARAKAVAVWSAEHPVEASAIDSLVARELDDYQLLDRLGHGGMGTVYKALHTKLDRLVALKVIARHRMNDRQTAVRFEREMMAIGRLAHPNIVQAFDAREVGDTPVLIMEYVDGLDLGELVRRHGPLPVADACELTRRAALGLQYAHEHGLVHRDIKPSNLMLSRDGELKILDLGLARLVDTSPEKPPEEPQDDGDASNDPASSSVDTPSLTGSNQAMGTADYMAPEQVSNPRTVDIRADIYSLGCTLYKLLTGQAPFGTADYTATLTKLAAHQTQPIRPIRELNSAVPARLASVIERMLAKSPDDRFAGPAEVATALEPFSTAHDLTTLLETARRMPPSDGNTPAPVPTHTAQPAASGGRFRLILTALAMAFLFGGLGLAAGIIITIKRGDQEVTVQFNDDNGNADKQIAPNAKPDKAQQKTPAPAVPDEEAIQGTWEIVENPSYERFPFIPPSPIVNKYTGEDSTETARINIADKFIRIRRKDGATAVYRYSINPKAEPKQIDILKNNLIIRGIYELNDGNLKLCLADRYLSFGKNRTEGERPKVFWAGLSNLSKLLVLRRIGNIIVPPDEKTVEGRWHVTSLSREIKMSEKRKDLIRSSRMIGVPHLTCAEDLIFDHFVKISTSRLKNDLVLLDNPQYDPMVLSFDATKTPHTFSWGLYRGHSRGIWKIDSDKLRLRFADLEKKGIGSPISGFDKEPTANELDVFLSRNKPEKPPSISVPSRRDVGKAVKPAPPSATKPAEPQLKSPAAAL